MLKDVLASGQAKLKEGSERMREDVAQMCEGLSVEEASAGVKATAAAAVAEALAASVAAQVTVGAESAAPGSAGAIERMLRDVCRARATPALP